MRRTSNRPGPRAGFTLVELLVVITIIAILFALTSAAVVKTLAKGDEVKLRNDISQLGAAVEAFKTDFQVSYIPDRFVVPPAMDPTGESLQFLTTAWPRINQLYLANTAQSRVLWGAPPGLADVYILQGHQTLVFFLGGARDANGTPIGFSNSPTDPLEVMSTTRKGPYFNEFATTRLQAFPFGSKPTVSPWSASGINAITTNNSTYRSFLDIYGTAPYLYFSSKKAGNDYNNLTTDKQFGCAPFQLSSTRFANPSAFQIISAGKDAVIGAGGPNWAGYSGGSASQTGYDDVSNFHPTLLGIANN